MLNILKTVILGSALSLFALATASANIVDVSLTYDNYNPTVQLGQGGTVSYNANFSVPVGDQITKAYVTQYSGDGNSPPVFTSLNNGPVSQWNVQTAFVYSQPGIYNPAFSYQISYNGTDVGSVTGFFQTAGLGMGVNVDPVSTGGGGVASAVPEVSTWLMFAIGFLAVGFLGYRTPTNRFRFT